MLFRLHLWIAGLALSLVLATPAGAQDPQVDPDSPAGTEYQLPTDRAREEASGGGSSGSSGRGATNQAPLFGAGVEDEKAKSVQNAGTDSDAGAVTHVEPEPGRSTPAIVRAQAPAPQNGGGGLVTVGAGAAGVLLLGGLVGLAWRRRT